MKPEDSMGKLAANFLSIIDGNINSIINDLFPLQYEKQHEAINLIVNYLHNTEIPMLESKSLSDELQEIDKIKNNLGDLVSYRKRSYKKYVQEVQK